MNRAKFLVIHGVTAEAWINRWDLVPCTYPCSECGRDCTTSIPFAYKTFRGLMAPPCSCGNDRTPYCLVRDPKYGDLFSGPLE